MNRETLYLIDATAFCYRAFYALPALANSSGQPTNAIYGFLRILNKILKEKKPDYLAVCFDVSRDTFRQKKFAEYKIQRPQMPDGLISQMPLLKQVIQAYKLPIFEKKGFEADDIIATLSKKAKKAGLSTVIVSSDKDILQLVDANTLVFSPYKDEGVVYDNKLVFERFGVSPEKITDIMALMGDSVDNIPGVPGIGEKTAVRLIVDFGSLNKLLENLDKIKPEKIRKSVEDNLTQLKLNSELVKLDDDVDIDFNPDDLRIVEPDSGELFNLFKKLEFKKLLQDLPQEEAVEVKGELIALEDKELRGLIKEGDDLVFYGGSAQGMIIFVGDKFYQINAARANLKSILEESEIKKLSYGLKEIKLSLAKEGIELRGLHFDIMIAAYLINPAKSGYSLEDISWDHLGNLAKKVTDNYEKTDLIKKLVPVLKKGLEDRQLCSLFYELEMPLVGVLAQMQQYGIKLDTQVLKELSRDVETRLVKLIESIYDLSGTQFNINSPKQLREILFEKLKLPVYKKSKTGPSTDEEVLRALSDKHKLPALLLEYRQLMKLKTTYIDTLPELVDEKTGMIHASFNQTGTETGRLSSSNPNLQNIPVKTDIGKNIRRAIIASSVDSILLSCDYSQIELRILAHLSKDDNLIMSFKDNLDIHKATAGLIYGLQEGEVSDEMRERAKRVNFGIIYGLTSYGLSHDLGISVVEAQNFIDAYFLRFPKVKEYIQQQIQIAKSNGFVTTILGRRRYIPEINNKNQGIRQFAERQAVNTPIQGSAADLIKLAMVKISDQIHSKGLRAKMIMQIHDELVFDVSRAELAEVKELVRERMENVMKLEVPVRVQIKKGNNWLEMEEVK